MNLAVRRFPLLSHRCKTSKVIALCAVACAAAFNVACDAQLPSSGPASESSNRSSSSDAAQTATNGLHAATTNGSTQRPNIILFIIDTLRADALGPYRGDPEQTPEIGRFARDAIVFENAFAQSSWTRASVASILTSQYAQAHGAEGRGDRLAESATLLSEILAEHGYHTGLITTNPNVGSFFGFDQGFGELLELFAPRIDDVVKPRELVATADDVATRASAWIDRAPEPFFLVVLSIDPHSPYSPPPEYLDKDSSYRGLADGTGPWINRTDLSPDDKAHIRALYQAEANYADHGFGKVVEGLRARGLDARSVIVLTSDHGEEFWEHGGRGHGRGLYRETLHVPLLIRDPARIQSGRRESRTVQTVDIFPTLLESASIPIPDGIAGRSLFAREAISDEPAFASLRLDDQHLASVATKKWKLIWNLDSGEKRLFDVHEQQERNDFVDPQVDSLSRSLTTHLAAVEERRREILGDQDAVPLGIDEIPDVERRLLIELGYIDDDAPSKPVPKRAERGDASERN